MKARGIRIEDEKKSDTGPLFGTSLELSDILKEIYNEDAFHWSIIDIYAYGYLDKDSSYQSVEDQANKTENSLFITWKDLSAFSAKFQQVIDLTVIGCKDKSLLHRYENEKEMYETCDMVLTTIDSCYWEIFTKDEALIDRLAKKYKKISFLQTDFLEGK